WLARLYREGVEPFGSLQKVSDHPSSFSGLGLAQGKFHLNPPSLVCLFDHLVGGREQHVRHVEAKRLCRLEVDAQLVSCDLHTPSTTRMSRSAPLSSARSASW